MAANPDTIFETIEFTLNGQTIEALPAKPSCSRGRAHRHRRSRTCVTPKGLRADGNCRACVVEIDGERVLAPSCCRNPTKGMVVNSDNERAQQIAKMVLELLLSDMPEQEYTLDNELGYWANKLEVKNPRFKPRHQPAADLSHPAIAVNLDACIQCTRCLRACRESQVNDVIGLAKRGHHAEIVFDIGDPMGESTCVACGECVAACPTGALSNATGAHLVEPTARSTRSAPTAASAACSPTTSRTTRSFASRVVTDRPTSAACASRAVTASTTSTTRSA